MTGASQGYPYPPQQQQTSYQHQNLTSPLNQFTQPYNAAQQPQWSPQMYQATMNTHSYNQPSLSNTVDPNAPLMGPPIRMGFGDEINTSSHSSTFDSLGMKRKRDAPFQGNQHPHHNHIGKASNGRPPSQGKQKVKTEVAPSVPSFGFALPAKPVSQLPPSAQAQRPKKKQRKFNQLGLTPRREEHEDSEEEVDEEAAFTQAGGE